MKFNPKDVGRVGGRFNLPACPCLDFLYCNMIDIIIAGGVVLAGGVTLTIKTIMEKRRQRQVEARAMLQLYDEYLNLLDVHKKTQEEINVVQAQQLESRVAEGCDIEMAEASVKVLCEFCPQGIENKINSLGTAGEREAFFRALTMRLAEAMKVKILAVNFKELDPPTAIGAHNGSEKEIQLNSHMFLDVELGVAPVGLVHALLHELRHAVQSEALFEGNSWGIAPSRLAEWAVSDANYVDCTQAYVLQANELDANWYARLVRDMFNNKK